MVESLDPKSKHKVTEAEVTATEPEDKWDVKMEFRTQLGVSKPVPPHIIGIDISTYYMGHRCI